jgi:uncharacterized integral membrane protein (TIGR00698 family)
MSFQRPLGSFGKQLAKYLLQGSVVFLGFGMNLREVIEVGHSGFLYTALSITAVMLAGVGLGLLLGVQSRPSFLISAGTAICGGSAIAAVGPITGASDEEMAVSLGAVFLLNSIALFVFPAFGFALHLSETQFGLWAALAIHDTSSVVGAAARYGPKALAIGTTVKLVRALWIVPLAAVTAVVWKRKTRIEVPWFILFFCIAASLHALLPQGDAIFAALNQVGRAGLGATLFLIGANLDREYFRQMGVRPLVQGILLWILVAMATLGLVVSERIHL